MVHEWFHYRYGVFDESGVNGDPLYPNGYQISHPEAPILPTSCTNVPLKGEWIGKYMFKLIKYLLIIASFEDEQ